MTVPVIASSGAGAVEHFSQVSNVQWKYTLVYYDNIYMCTYVCVNMGMCIQVFRDTDVLAALAAGIFHRNEVR